MVGALPFFGVEIPTYPALGAAARRGAYQHTPARRVGVEAPHTYIPRRAAWVWKRRIPIYPPKGAREQTPKRLLLAAVFCASWVGKTRASRRRESGGLGSAVRAQSIKPSRYSSTAKRSHRRPTQLRTHMLRGYVFFFALGRPPGKPYIYLHTRGARGDARRADTYIHRAGGGGRRGR